MKSLKSLLESLIESINELKNTKATWSKIGKRDEFKELNFKNRLERDLYLRKWIGDNPYNQNL